MHNPPPFSPGLGTGVGGVKVFVVVFFCVLYIYKQNFFFPPTLS